MNFYLMWGFIFILFINILEPFFFWHIITWKKRIHDGSCFWLEQNQGCVWVGNLSPLLIQHLKFFFNQGRTMSCCMGLFRSYNLSGDPSHNAISIQWSILKNIDRDPFQIYDIHFHVQFFLLSVLSYIAVLALSLQSRRTSYTTLQKARTGNLLCRTYLVSFCSPQG